MPEPAPGTAGPATVTDAFALLGLPRLPWLDPAVVRDQFLAASRDQHPDRHHGSSEAARARVQSAYTGLNAAQQCLRESRTRITHLLELETGARPRDVVQLPAGVNALFGPVGAACHGADQCLREREAASSPLVRLQSLEAALDWQDRLMQLLGETERQSAALEQELAAMNPRWESAPPPGSPGRSAALPLARLEEIQRTLSFLHRWSTQLRDRQNRLLATL